MVFRQKTFIMVSQEWWLHLDNAPVHTTGSVVDFLAAKGVKMVPQLLYLPYHTPADFFLFPRAKAELAGLTLMQETFKNTWGGVSGPLPRKTSPPPSSTEWSGAKSASGSAGTVKKIDSK
jgi:hypothetical protein